MVKWKCESHGDVKAKNCTGAEWEAEQGEGAIRQVGRRGLEVNIKHNTHTHT